MNQSWNLKSQHNILFKKVISLALLLYLLLFSLSGFAQVIPAECEDDESERTDPLTHLDTIPEFFSCVPRNMATPSAVILFNSYAKVTFRFETDVEGTTAPVFYREMVGNGTGSGVLLSAQPGQTVHKTLPLNKDYELITINTCNDTVVLSQFSTRINYVDVISTPKPIFEAVMSWTKESENQDIYDLISGLEEVEISERIAFLQQFLKSQPLSVMFDGAFPPRSAFVTTDWRPEQDCLCRTMKVVATRNVSPIEDVVGNVILPNYGSDVYNFTGNRGHIRWDFSYAGPARWRNLDGETTRCRNEAEGMTWGGLNPSQGVNDTVFSFFASMRFGQACFDANWNPKNCECTQEIDISWKYDSHIEARANTKTGRICFNMPGRSALAAIDDICMVAIGRKNADGMEVLRFVDFGRGTVIRECSRDFDENRLVDLSKLGFNILALVKGLDITTGFPAADAALNQLWDLFYKDQIKNTFKSLLTEPWIPKQGLCGVDKDEINLRKSRTESLNGQDEFEVILSAATFMQVEGLTHWKATARHISGFRLSGVLKQNFVTPPNTYCCTRSYGSYIAHSMFSPGDGGPMTSVYRDEIGTHFNHQNANFFGILEYNDALSSFVIPGEIGEVHGQPIPNCNTIINDRWDAALVNAGAANDPMFVMRGRDLWMLRQTTTPGSEGIGYLILDTQGRMLQEGLANGNEVLLHQFPRTVSSGIYIVGVKSSQSFQTYKIFVP